MMFHMCLSVEGALVQTDSELKWMVGNLEKDGRPCRNVQEVRQALVDALAAGWEFLPDRECDNFDPKRGCLGHPASGERTENLEDVKRE